MEIAHHLSPRSEARAPQEPHAGAVEAVECRLRAEKRGVPQVETSGKELVRWKYQRYIKDYLRCVASMDENVGRVLDYLETSGLAKNTIVIYSSDQGFYLGEHGWFDKRFMYEESYRMPLLVRWPGVTRPGSAGDALVSNLDFAETFLSMAGVTVSDDMQGTSLVPFLRGQTPSDWRTSLYYHYYEYPSVHMVQKHDGVRTTRYKLIHFYELGEWELYDLQNDPHEMHSIYADASSAGIVERLKAELTRLRAQYQVPAVDNREKPRRKKAASKS